MLVDEGQMPVGALTTEMTQYPGMQSGGGLLPSLPLTRPLRKAWFAPPGKVWIPEQLRR